MTVQDHIDRYISFDIVENLRICSYEALRSMIRAEKSTDSGNITFTDLIVKMEPHLTSIEDKARNRATMLMAELLESHTAYPFQAGELHLLIVFFNKRLSDYPSIIPSLKALLALIRHHAQKLDHKFLDVIDIFQTIFAELHLQGLAQSIRQKVMS